MGSNNSLQLQWKCGKLPKFLLTSKIFGRIFFIFSGFFPIYLKPMFFKYHHPVKSCLSSISWTDSNRIKSNFAPLFLMSLLFKRKCFKKVFQDDKFPRITSFNSRLTAGGASISNKSLKTPDFLGVWTRNPSEMAVGAILGTFCFPLVLYMEEKSLAQHPNLINMFLSLVQ